MICQSYIDEYELVTVRNKLDRLYKYVSEVYVINNDYSKSQKESISDDLNKLLEEVKQDLYMMENEERNYLKII